MIRKGSGVHTYPWKQTATGLRSNANRTYPRALGKSRGILGKNIAELG
jgi:hypothetical protein